jgi:hypothetical protein
LKGLATDLILILDPLCAPACDVGTIALASRHSFFEAQLLGVDEILDRSVIHFHPTFSYLIDQPAQD